MNQTPRSNRTHIAIFGRRNAGKSSVINALTNQQISLVSDVAGTTTDPVFKSIELLPLGPCVLIDTAGIDDIGTLGKMRVERTYDIINKTDIGLIIFDHQQTDFSEELQLIKEFKKRQKPFLLVGNKTDQGTTSSMDALGKYDIHFVSALTKAGMTQLKQQIGQTVQFEEEKFRIVGDLIQPGEFVVLVTPIDKAAPKGRLILPQQQTIRDILESDAIAIVTKEHELRETLQNLHKKPALVITDSQAFLKVSADTPQDIPLTSFSILFARNKGDLEELVQGALAIDHLQSGDTILVSEGCTHHRQSDDIGTVKIPRWLRQYTGKDFNFIYSSGYSFPKELDEVQLVIHCGGCMLNKTEMMYRIKQVVDKDIPIVNYGVLIAYVQGIFERALKPFPLANLIFQEQHQKKQSQ
ncbi:[FeFe] hydrogenase H-cluster maturation GTPase HydF [Candidatus Xianfuyuplasma coldseepsis]|uniref:[FeFe] hydrogenase H-cluster maturation GTPase HydF n=1 Tax=Candidatus Xianfuyuplasma coldseepsis TaxID=2782163 RepID=A0A7L7KRR5_9MOLU|nr:[FeFe] hydrogenase H-cluster maturation GTPase HydF [Xianfuyuplasma coldseepsis]QMS85397.1 [FeFe] hydrogenase H-cluster maturation GTPase HydF [Xianfuyuplasma coldseepsis]